MLNHKRDMANAVLHILQVIQSRCFVLAEMANDSIKDPILADKVEKIRLATVDAVSYLRSKLEVES